MLHRVDLFDGSNLRGLLPSPGQMESPGNHGGGARVEPQLRERREWLLQLGLSPTCAQDLAMHTLERPEFSLAEFQEHWRQLRLQLGPKRQYEVDAIVLRRIRELLQSGSPERNRPRTPSPPHGINWNSTDCDTPATGRLGYDSPMRCPTDRQPERRMTSTPVYELKINAIEPDFYDINEDPRNVNENYKAPHPSAFIASSTNDERYDGNNYQNNGIHFPEAYNIDANARNMLPDDRQLTGYNNQHFNNNFDYVGYFNNNYRQQLPAHAEAMNNFNLDNEARELQQQQQQNRNFYNNYNNLQFQNNIERNAWHFDNRNYADMNNMNMNSNQYPMGFPAPRPLLPELQIRIDNRNNNFGEHNNRKRTLDSPSEQYGLKRRFMEETKQIFKIGDVELPRIQMKTLALPQPESKSYAIKFFKRQYCPIVGGMIMGSPRAPVEPIPDCPTHPNRTAAKRIRQDLRNEWLVLYRNKNYKDWDVWWNDFKWCGPGIERELERYKGINLMDKSFLHIVMNYDKPQTVKRLLNQASVALELNKTNYQSIMGTIFEIMNVKFLGKLNFSEIGRLQDMIRYMPNHLWTYKMRSMVYLWSRYCRVRTSSDHSEDAAKYIWATHTQWYSALFHWLAKQAFDELKRISRIEWPEHVNKYPTIECEPLP
ncbi:uncharacterized protein Dmoj_GI17190, isoform B [Drosophila mojavensis]|uniref:Uncharacterized protein, isoform B n=1 Tax=Drosophila mojavensis TaxID=7230 RepID=B4KK12_DROMO|nr:uncharacterized protein Dmoj_GI17190, isoform B [Drosophila mojavensis]